jgi:serine phosphatase RsbU (regulator of sigma subunit)
VVREEGVGAAIIAPMTAGARVVGALVFVNPDDARPFDRRDLAIATELARRTGLAVENSRLAGERAHVAGTLQRGLLPPSPPEMNGFEVATMYRPAGEVNEVGGDFYEAFEIDGGWMVTIGDVMGRGAAAASLTALARYTIRTAGKLTGDPRMAAALVDHSLKEGGDILLCSAVIAVLPDTDMDPARISVLIAGHPPPLRLRSGKVEPVGMSGPLLGAPSEPRWELAELDLELGDQLVLYTDGVTEARGREDRFGEERLRAQLARAATPAAVVASVETALELFLAGDPEDDAAVLAIRRIERRAPRKAPEPDRETPTVAGSPS